MKKYLCLIMAALLALSCFAAMAEETEVETTSSFDRSVFEGLEGYSENKFDKAWDYYVQAPSSDSSMILALLIHGKLEDPGIDRVVLVPARSLTDYDGVEKIQALIGETVYTMDVSGIQKQLEVGMAILTDQTSSFFEVIANADEVALRATTDSGSFDATFSADNDEFRKIQTALQELFRQGGTKCFSQEGRITAANVGMLQTLTVD